MKRLLRRVICGILLAVMLVGTAKCTSYAASDYPELFDFSDTVLRMNAGETKDLWIFSEYAYVCYLGPHTSKDTRIICSCKRGSEYAKVQIGADETVTHVDLYFYVDQDDHRDGSKYCTVQVQISGINRLYTDPNVLALKSYANNNAAFNAYYYYVNYPDLQVAFGLNGDALLNHYLTFGQKEGRIANKLK